MRYKNLKLSGLMLAGIIVIVSFIYAVNIQPVVIGDSSLLISRDSDLQTFNSYKELTDFLKNGNNNRYGTETKAGFMTLMGVTAPSSITIDGEGADIVTWDFDDNMVSVGTVHSELIPEKLELVDYSNTNVQVVGVDEPDIVKTDGQYLYIVDDNRVLIVKATPSENAKIECEISMEYIYSIKDIFINGNKLVIFSESRNYPIYKKASNDEPIIGIDIISPPRWYSCPDTNVHIYDLKILESPKKVKQVTVPGRYTSSRMIGDFVYVITTHNSNDFIILSEKQLIVPKIMVDDEVKEIDIGNIEYVNDPDNSKSFTNVFSVNVRNEKDDVESKIYLMGSSNVIYVSKENIYITYHTRNYNYDDINEIAKEILKQYLPPTFFKELDAVESLSIDDYQKKSVTEWIIQSYSDDLTDEVKEEIAREINKRIEKTTINRIRIKEGEVDYKGQGDVPGNVDNQFSLSEYYGFLRVSTTNEGRTISGFYSTNLQKQNNVYVLNMDLDIVGSVEGLAPNEEIYATRFLGDKCYLVTYRRIDPFFVIDLANPYNPKVLGELKIPGYSTYLHPYDESHIIGIGIDGRKVKVSLFDVTDLSNPIEMSKYTIDTSGNRWSSGNSEALYEHKAFLFDKERNLLVIPCGDYSKQDAYVFNINLEDGIELRGIIEHSFDEDDSDYNNWNSYGFKIKRSLFIGDVLFTLSDNMLKLNNLDDLSELNYVDLV